MKKSLMILPPFLFIFSMYSVITEVRATTEGTSEIVQLQDTNVTLTETPPEIVKTEPETAVSPLVETLPVETTSTESIVPEESSTPTPTTETVIPEESSTPTASTETTIPEESSTPTASTETTIPEESSTPTTNPEPVISEESLTPTTTTETVVPEESSTPTTNPEPVISEESAIPSPITELPDSDSSYAEVAPAEPAVVENIAIEEATASEEFAPQTTDFTAMAFATETSGPSEYINYVDIADNVVALTFDDGHSDVNLYDILSNLNYFGVKATFFMNGDADPTLLQQIVADGHQLANHSYSHADSTILSSDQLASDVNLMEDYIQETTGTSSLPFFRAPYGAYNSATLDTVGSLGYRYTIGWSVDTLDWTGISDVAVSNAVINNVHPGAIVLMHASVGAANTSESLWYSIPALQNAGYSFATVSDLLSLGGYYSAVDEEEPVVVVPVEEDYSDDVLSQVINQVNTSEKTVSLTISDASDAANVRQILANLAANDVKATFFLNGLTDPDVLSEIVAQGHEIGNHTYTQDDATIITVDELVWEVNALETLVQDSTGGATSRPYFRAPMGVTNDAVLATVASMGYDYTIGWTYDTQDWSGTQTASQLSSAVVNNLSPGSIFLFHGNSSAANTPAALLETIAAVRNLGYNFATISGLLALEGSLPEDTENPVEEPNIEIPTGTSPSQLFNQVNTDQKVVSLTISGVSDDERIDDILQNLASLGAKATFFVDGTTSQAALNKIVAAGHEIGNQAYSGVDVTGMTTEQLNAEVNLTETFVENAGTAAKPYFRAPAGAIDASVLETVGSQGYDYTIGWSIDPRDWSGISASEITSIVTSQLAPGSIILMDAGTTATGTAAALLTTIAQARALGYEFTTISGLLAWEGIFSGVAPIVVEEPNEPEEDWTGTSRYVNRVDTGQNVLALTFDDGDDYGNLYDIIYNLNSLGIKATFFLNGTTDPELMKFIVDSGHQLSNHTYSHNDDSTALSAEDLAYDINLMEDYILETTGVSSKPYFRAPAGAFDDSVLETVGSLGYRYTIGWTQDTRDWEGLSDVAIAASVTEYLDAGSIYLLHANPTASGTPESLWYIAAEARSQGYEFVTIDQLMALEDVYDDGTDTGNGDYTEGTSRFVEQVDTEQAVISLTFDDLGDSEVLQQILDALAEMNVKATFFADGSADPSMLYEVVAQGHELGNHTYSHDFSTYWTIAEFTEELNAMDGIIENATGVSSRPLFRPPYGDYDTSVLETAGNLGYEYTIGWTTDSLDWEGTNSASEIAANVLDNLAPGAIYLMHAVPESANTPASLYEIIQEARSRGYAFATITDLLALEGINIAEPEDPTVEEPVGTELSQLINQVNTSEKIVSLTISDASSAANLRQILANLAEVGVKATFFLNGLTDSTLIDDILAQGHEIGNHTYTQEDATAMTTAELTADLNAMENMIQNAAGVTSRPYFRAPMGETNNAVLETAASLGYDYTIGWTVDTRDWSGTLTAAQVSAAVVNNLAPGAIYLLHGNADAATTPAALLQMIAAARAQGYNFATISGLLALEGIYPEIPPIIEEPGEEEPPTTSPSQLVNQVNTNRPVVSLTISDASSAANLRQILANLAEVGVKATFFLNGLTDPTLIDDILAQGHEIGNHTYTQEDATAMTTAQLTSDLNAMENMIQDATGTTSKPYFRAPMGETNNAVLATAGSLGYTYAIGWTVDTRDWSGTLTAAQVSAAVVNNLAPGAIYLLHGNADAATTPAALLQMIAAARAQGYDFATISGLLALEGDYSEEPLPEPEPVEEFTFPNLEEFGDVTNPVITRNDVTDVFAPLGTADPFIVYDGEIYHMFFEVLGEYDIVNKSFTDKVAHAYSSDLINWTYTQVVLSQETDGTRAAYPSVFEYEDSYYMVPDLAGNIESFVATDFPLEWEYNSTLMEGNFVDTNIFEVGDIWYMTTSENPYNSIGLYYNTSGDWRNNQWTAHPAGLIIEEDLTEKGYRGAGNPFVYEDYVVMPVQVTPVATNVYGEYTVWFKLSDLSETTVTVDYLGEALGATQNGTWTDEAIHHISHAPYGDGYIYAVDGYAYYAASTGAGEYTIGLFTDTNFA